MGPNLEMPAGAEIVASSDARGVTLSWSAYKAGGGRMIGWFLALWIGAWLSWCAFELYRGLSGGGAGAYFWAAFAVINCAVGLYWLRHQYLPPTPESVRLEADALRYDPGRGPAEARSCAERPDGKIVPVTPAPAVAVARTAVRKFGIDCVNERERLYVDTDGRRFEIGGCLTGPERAWVLAVLQQWLGRSAAVPPWAREARHKEGAQP